MKIQIVISIEVAEGLSLTEKERDSITNIEVDRMRIAATTTYRDYELAKVLDVWGVPYA